MLGLCEKVMITGERGKARAFGTYCIRVFGFGKREDERPMFNQRSLPGQRSAISQSWDDIYQSLIASECLDCLTNIESKPAFNVGATMIFQRKQWSERESHVPVRSERARCASPIGDR